MTALDNMVVDVSVVLGTTKLPLQKLLRMGRGAVLALGQRDTDPVEILANGHPIARGQIIVQGTSILVEVVDLIRKPVLDRAPGATIGGLTPDRNPPGDG